MKKNRNWATWKRLVIRLQKNSYSDRHYGRSWLTRTWRNFRWHRTRRRYIPIVHHCHVHQDSSSHVNTGHIWLQKWLLKLTKFHTSNWKYQVKFRWVFINVFVLHFVKKFVQKNNGIGNFQFRIVIPTTAVLKSMSTSIDGIVSTIIFMFFKHGEI